jgi:hypothetical protein
MLVLEIAGGVFLGTLLENVAAAFISAGLQKRSSKKTKSQYEDLQARIAAWAQEDDVAEEVK